MKKERKNWTYLENYDFTMVEILPVMQKKTKQNKKQNRKLFRIREMLRQLN